MLLYAWFQLVLCCCCSVAKLCPTLCDNMDWSTPGFSPLTLGACLNSCPSSQRCYLTISSPAAPFSFCLQSFPASGSFPMSQLFASDGPSIGVFIMFSNVDILVFIISFLCGYYYSYFIMVKWRCKLFRWQTQDHTGAEIPLQTHYLLCTRLILRWLKIIRARWPKAGYLSPMGQEESGSFPLHLRSCKESELGIRTMKFSARHSLSS